MKCANRDTPAAVQLKRAILGLLGASLWVINLVNAAFEGGLAHYANSTYKPSMSFLIMKLPLPQMH